MKSIYPTLYSLIISFIVLIISNIIAFILLQEYFINESKNHLNKNLYHYMNLIQIYHENPIKNQNLTDFLNNQNNIIFNNEYEFLFIQKKSVPVFLLNLPLKIEFFQNYLKQAPTIQVITINKKKFYIKYLYYKEYEILGGFEVSSINSKIISLLSSINILIFILILLITIMTYYISKYQLEIPFKNLFIIDEKIKQILIKLIHRQKINKEELTIEEKKFPPLIQHMLKRYINILVIFSNTANIFTRYTNEIFSYNQKEDVYKKLHFSLNELIPILHISILELNFSTNRFEKIYEYSELNIHINNEQCLPEQCIAYRTNQIQVLTENHKEAHCCFSNQILFNHSLKNKILFVIPILSISKITGIGLLIFNKDDIINLYSEQFLTFEQITEILKNHLQIYFNIAGIISHNISILESYKTMAITDPLTNLYNRRYIIETLNTLLYISERNKGELAILMIDIDNFKNFNDEYGHQIGDEVLKIVAKVLKQSIRKSDIVGRFGGEEFIIILPNTNQKYAFKVAEKVRKNIENIHYKNFGLENIPKITISIGISIFPLHGYSYDHLLRKADEALYQAKKSGKNRTMVALTSPSMSISTNISD
ncbi:MAG: hypothetical protein KatS3mg129_0287 [Leptospiraceae bacterium]|nr:MAG: hypothetical protein KatS3mg129_0287 [Leptospiraceae bacterium]